MVNVFALIYGIAAIVNMVWPRMDGTPWYVNLTEYATAALFRPLRRVQQPLALDFFQDHQQVARTYGCDWAHAKLWEDVALQEPSGVGHCVLRQEFSLYPQLEGF